MSRILIMKIWDAAIVYVIFHYFTLAVLSKKICNKITHENFSSRIFFFLFRIFFPFVYPYGYDVTVIQISPETVPWTISKPLKQN